MDSKVKIITRRTFIGLLGAAGMAAPACLRSRSNPSRRPHVVCVLVDQLRKDSSDLWLKRVNSYASRGIVFNNMRSVAPWTYPSVVSMLSGLYPQQHGADGHLVKNVLATFDRKVPLLQNLLRGAGYRTSAFVTNPFLHKWNPFHEGFDYYDIDFIGSQGNQRGRGDLVWKPDRMFADSVNETLFAHFRGFTPKSPEFTYIHYIDVHGPWKGAPFTPTYPKAISFVDQRISDLYDFFLDRYDGDMIFFVTSDHGRYLKDDLKVGYGPRWRQSKKSLHDFNLRIPFMVLPSRHVRESRKVNSSCMNADFLPTVMDWLGLDMSYRIPGVSLMPQMRGDTRHGNRNRSLYAKNSAFGYLSDCMIRDGRKYLRFFNPKTRDLTGRRVFDLIQDPRETRSLGDDFEEMAPRLNDLAGFHGLKFTARFDPVRKDLNRNLRTLGYLK